MINNQIVISYSEVVIFLWRKITALIHNNQERINQRYQRKLSKRDFLLNLITNLMKETIKNKKKAKQMNIESSSSFRTEHRRRVPPIFFFINIICLFKQVPKQELNVHQPSNVDPVLVQILQAMKKLEENINTKLDDFRKDLTERIDAIDAKLQILEEKRKT